MNKSVYEPEIKCLVFRTNVTENYQVCRLVYVLEKTDGVLSWNLDLENWENILRLEYSDLEMDSLLLRLSEFDIRIEELPIW